MMRISRWCTCTARGDSESEWEAETRINRLIGLNGGYEGSRRNPLTPASAASHAASCL